MSITVCKFSKIFPGEHDLGLPYNHFCFPILFVSNLALPQKNTVAYALKNVKVKC